MDPELKKLLIQVAIAINQLRAALQGNLSADQDAAVEASIQALTNTEASDVSSLKAQLAAQEDEITALTDRVAALETAAAGVGADADAIDQQLNPPVGSVPLALSPTSLSGSVGAAITGAFSPSGGAAPYVFTPATSADGAVSLLADGTYSGTLLGDTTLEVVLEDSSTPPLPPLSISVPITTA